MKRLMVTAGLAAATLAFAGCANDRRSSEQDASGTEAVETVPSGRGAATRASEGAARARGADLGIGGPQADGNGPAEDRRGDTAVLVPNESPR